jgi:hypothetical protein
MTIGPGKKKRRRKKRKKRKAAVALTVVGSIPADGSVQPTKRARLGTVPFPSRFLASEDVHYEASLSERQTLFVESDEEGPIYIVPRNDGTQIHIARHLACRHTVRKLSYAEECLATLAPNRPVRYYCPNQDHEDDFFVVWNKEESTVPLTSTFPFPALHDYALANGSAGAIFDLECGCLMSQWPYGDNVLSMGDICKQLGAAVSIEVTSIEVSVRRTLPQEAKRRLQVSPVPYEIPRWYST